MFFVERKDRADVLTDLMNSPELGKGEDCIYIARLSRIRVSVLSMFSKSSGAEQE